MLEKGNKNSTSAGIGDAKHKRSFGLQEEAARNSCYVDCSVWYRALTKERNCRRLETVQRSLALRVCSGYRTVSTEFALVLASLPPAKIEAEARLMRYQGIGEKAVREQLMKNWNRRWMESDKGMWTKRLIPDVQLFANTGKLIITSHNFLLAMETSASFCIV